MHKNTLSLKRILRMWSPERIPGDDSQTFADRGKTKKNQRCMRANFRDRVHQRASTPRRPFITIVCAVCGRLLPFNLADKK